MVRISQAKKLAKQQQVKPLIQFPEACPISRLKSPGGRIFTSLDHNDVEVLMRLGWQYVEGDNAAR